MIFGPGPLRERRCERGCCPFPNNGGEGEAVPGQSRSVLVDGVQRTERARQARLAGYGREMEGLLVLMRAVKSIMSPWAIEVRAN